MSDDYKVLQIMLYCVEVRGNGFRWFKDKDEAIFFPILIRKLFIIQVYFGFVSYNLFS